MNQIYDYAYKLITEENKKSEEVIKTLMGMGLSGKDASDMYYDIIQKIDLIQNQALYQALHETALKMFPLGAINGCGTTLYGSADKNEEDDSYTATQWIIIFFIPIIPVASYRILSASGGDDGFTVEHQYQMIKVKLHKKQVLKTYLYILTAIAIVALLVYLFIYFKSK
jgi:hypothetical protein